MSRRTGRATREKPITNIGLASELSTDEQGRQVFEGRATYYDITANDSAKGDFRAILTDFPVAFPPAE
jgi:hypothetical protein